MSLAPNLDRLTVGVDLGDHGSHSCILGLEGETLAEGQLRSPRRLLVGFPRLPLTPKKHGVFETTAGDTAILQQQSFVTAVSSSLRLLRLRSEQTSF